MSKVDRLAYLKANNLSTARRRIPIEPSEPTQADLFAYEDWRRDMQRAQLLSIPDEIETKEELPYEYQSFSSSN